MRPPLCDEWPSYHQQQQQLRFHKLTESVKLRWRWAATNTAIGNGNDITESWRQNAHCWARSRECKGTASCQQTDGSKTDRRLRSRLRSRARLLRSLSALMGAGRCCLSRRCHPQLQEACRRRRSLQNLCNGPQSALGSGQGQPSERL